MMTHTTSAPQFKPAARTLQTVMVVGREPDERVLETVTDSGSYDVVFVEPIATAYSRIKCVAPSLVVLCLEFNDPASFQVMSMLKLDRDTASIPVVTCLLEPVPANPDL